MKNLLTISALLISTLTYSQSKKELKTQLSEAQQQLFKTEQEAETYKQLSNNWKAKYDGLSQQNAKLKDLTNQIIKILPYLTISEGFPEKYYPMRDNIEMYNEVNSKGYGSGDTSISSKYNCAYFPLSNPGKPDSVIILGVIDSTLSRSDFGIINGCLPVLYDNKIRFTSLRYLKGSRASKQVESFYKKKVLIDKYGEEIGSKIYSGIPWIGMSFSELYEMFGVHDDLNTYENAFGKVYSYTYRSTYETYVITVQKSKVTDIMKI